jgi:predicted nuclease of predicted toxin-antitoxin system
LSQPIRFHADEHIGRAVIEGLRRRGIDVSTTSETGLVSATDVRQLNHARETSRVLVTQDTDFLRLHTQGVGHSGIAFFRQGETTGEILRMLVLLFDVLTAEEIAGRVEFL